MMLKSVLCSVAILALSACASNGTQGRGAAGMTGSAVAPVSISPETNRALDTAVRDQPVTWSDAEAGTETKFTALRLFQREDGAYCREFTQTVSKGSDQATTRGVACRESDGTWRANAG